VLQKETVQMQKQIQSKQSKLRTAIKNVQTFRSHIAQSADGARAKDRHNNNNKKENENTQNTKKNAKDMWQLYCIFIIYTATV